MNLFAALRRTPADPDLPRQATDEDLLAWAEQLRSLDEPRRTRPLVAAPIR